MPSQVENGKAFEYALAKVYNDYLASENNRVWLQDNVALNNAKRCFEIQEVSSQRGFYVAAEKTIETLVAIEPAVLAVYDMPVGTDLEFRNDSTGRYFIDNKTGKRLP